MRQRSYSAGSRSGRADAAHERGQTAVGPHDEKARQGEVGLILNDVR